MRSTADLLVAKGLSKLGYVHVDMDGGWQSFIKPHFNATGSEALP